MAGNKIKGHPPVMAAFDVPSSTLSPHGHQEAGFTLIEVIAVLVVAAILATTILFRTSSSTATVGLRAVAVTIAAGLRQSRGRAIRTNREIVALINVSGRQIDWGTGRGPLALKSSIAIRVTAAQSEMRGGAVGVRFFPNGSSTGGRIQLSLNGVSQIVNVNWLTGNVLVEEIR